MGRTDLTSSRKRGGTSDAWAAPRISVKFGLPLVGPQILMVRVANDSAVPVTIASIQLRVRRDPERRGLSPFAWMAQLTGLSQHLKAGEHWDAPPVPIEPLKAEIAKLGFQMPFKLLVVMTDAAGREHEKAFKIKH